jgi:RNA-dependent RNA polymerase
MFLEGKKVPRSAFEKIQQMAIAEALLIDSSLENFHGVVSEHGLGYAFRIPTILQKLREKYGLELVPTPKSPGIDNPFFKQLRQVARTDVLRNIKHDARIPIPKGHLLVGVADEGPAYLRNGYQDVFVLEEGKIFGKNKTLFDQRNCPDALDSMHSGVRRCRA